MITKQKVFSYHVRLKKPFKVLGTGLLAFGMVVSTPGISNTVGGNLMSAVEASGTVEEFNKKSALRSSASSKAKAVLFVKPGNKAQVLRVSGNWTKVKVGTKTGWTPSRDLTVSGTSAPVVTKMKIYNKNSAVREKMDTKSKALVFVKTGQKATLIEISGSWTKVKVGTKSGWTLSADLSDEVVEPTPPITAVSGTKKFNKNSAVREKMDTKSKALVFVKTSQKAMLIGVSGTWTKVKVGTKTGWVPSADLKDIVVVPPIQAVGGTREFNKNTAVRESMDIKSKAMAFVKEGQKATLIEVSDIWTKVKVGTKTGWVPSADLRVIPEPDVIAGERVKPSDVMAKLANDSRFEYNPAKNEYNPENYKMYFSEFDRLYVAKNDDGRLSTSNWFGDAYAHKVSLTTRNALMTKQYASSVVMGEVLYGEGTKEAKAYADAVNNHIREVERLVLADWHNRMKIFRQGTFSVNGDNFTYYYGGTSVEVWY